jgi:His Kinase A (phospho-acceptor) domain
MARIDRPSAGTKRAAAARAEADPKTADPKAAHPIDWRQLSHELRTPLNAILGNVELLLDGSAGPLSAQARTCVAEVQVAGRQLLHQVRLLLAWSELSASGSKPVADTVDLIALIREALTVESSRPAQIDPQDACFQISGDPFWLRMLVTEIVALYGAPGAAPMVRLESCAGRRALGFVWSDFCADRAGALRMALIEGIARLQGVVLASKSDGLTLHWPAEQLDRPGAARRAQQPT